MPAKTNNQNLEELNKQIYEHSLELAAVNKTLSLLRKLYQISLQALEPASISEKISEIIRLDLNMEFVGVFVYDEPGDILQPFKFSGSDRFGKSQVEVSLNLDSLQIPKASKQDLFKTAILDHTFATASNLEGLWGSVGDIQKLTELSQKAHIQSVVIDPLITEGRVIGSIVFGLNRTYDTLTQFEIDAIKSFIDVVAVALDKALLYEQLKEANAKLQALDKARAEFITIASHQLRTPPATIKWYLNAVMAGDFGELTQELRSALERANVTNEVQIATISDLLNASRIERGKMEFFFEEGDLEPIVRNLVDQLQPLAEMHKQTIIYRQPKGVLPPIMMDKEKVHQVINNMIDNAIKYSKQGDITVALEVDDEYVTVKVIDTGKGIDPEEAPKLFGKYSRGKDSATHATGLGLGMYVAKIIIEQHHGKIWAESKGIGKGATFAFSLPVHSNVSATTIDLTEQVS